MENIRTNSISRFIILLTVLGYMCIQSYTIIIIGFIPLGILWYLYNQHETNHEKSNEMKETFENIKTQIFPTEKNPMMNVMLNDYKDNPTKPPSALSDDPMITAKVNETTKQNIIDAEPRNKEKDKLFKDLGDELEFEQSMRAFHTTANTQIPNDQKGFTDFCYGNLPSDKNVAVH